MNGSDKGRARPTAQVPERDARPAADGPPDTDSWRTVVQRGEGRRLPPVVGCLLVIEGIGKGQTRPIYEGSNSIGRLQTNTIALEFDGKFDEFVARKEHALIMFDNGVFWIREMGHRNPIKINGDVLDGQRRVRFNDEIEVGITRLRLVKH